MAPRLAKHGVNIVLAARTLKQSESEFPGSLKQTESEARLWLLARKLCR